MTKDKDKDPKAREEPRERPPAPRDPASQESPEPEPKEPHPTKGAGRKHNVQRRPEDQRGNPDPKQR